MYLRDEQKIAVAPNFVNPVSKRRRNRRSLKLGGAVNKPNGAGIFLHQKVGMMLCHVFSEHSLEGGKQSNEISGL